MIEGPQWFSRKSAQEVLDSLADALSRPNKDAPIEVIYKDPAHGETDELHPPLWLTPTDDKVIDLADNSEIVQCTTHDGLRASVWLGEKSTRTQHPALIILGKREART